MAINFRSNTIIKNLRVGPLSGGGNGGGGGGSSEPSYLAVGAYRKFNEQGRVYVYDTSNYSTAPIELSTPVPTNGSKFGVYSTFNSTSLIVGAEQYGSLGEGAILVYSSSDLTATPTVISPSDGANRDYFGHSIAANDEYIAVGAYSNDTIASDAGAVYVYDATNLSATPTKLAPSGLDGTDYFGKSLTIAGTNLVVGARRDDDQGDNAGAAYVYDLTNLSATPTKLTPSSVGIDDEFGYYVAATSDYIVVGAIKDDDQGSNAGAVYVYDVNNLSATPTKLTPSGLDADSLFGATVAVSDEYLAVGSPGDTVGSTSYAGAVYVYDINNLSAAPTRVVAPTPIYNGAYSWYNGLTLKGSSLVVGSSQANSSSGIVYVYDLNNLSNTPTIITDDNPQSASHFGYSVSLG